MITYESLVLCFLVTLGQKGVQESPKLEELIKDTAKARLFLSRALDHDDLWLQEDHRDRLMSYLDAALQLRPVDAAPALARNITLRSRHRSLLPVDKEFPAYAVLAATGVRGTKAIVDELASFDALDIVVVTDDDRKKKFEEAIRLGHRAHRELKQHLLVLCLVQMFEEGGFGRDLARKRLELEVTRRKGNEKERLLKALEHASLK